MCHACVIDSVKERMLSRRKLLKSAAATTMGAAGLSALSPAVQAMSHSDVSDLTHELHEGFHQQFFAEQKFAFKDNGFNLFELRVNEHTGTHIDAPLHFSADGQSVAQIPIANLVCPLCVVDIREKASADADAQVTPDDLKAWIETNGDIPDNACVAMLSGWAEHVNTEKFRNSDGEVMHFPGFHAEAAAMLLETGAIGMAVDTLSLDYGISADFATHYAWLPEGRWGLECVAGLDTVPAKGATMVVGAAKHRGGSGGQARVLALS